MIPVRLYLRDFMSYGEPGEELDFSFHTACLCGDNGNGKSALLDAMTWALWGRAPRLEGTQSKTEEVIRRADGVNEALVEFQFSVDDELYRVLRRLRRGRGQTLELYLSQGDSWRPLTGATKTDTQGVIQSLLGLDYHTFVMSSFLFQGRADSFTRAAPTERKEVLGGILRLDVYDELAKRARDLARECEGRAKQLADEVERLQAQADCEAEVEQRAQAAAAVLAEAEKSLAQCDEGLEQARTRKATAERAAEELRRVEAGLKQAAAHADSLARQESGLRRRVEGYRAALAEEGAVREAMARLEQARERDADLSARREQAAEADSVRQQARAAIGAEQARLEQELQHAENAVAEARKAAGEADDVARQTAEFESQIRACQDAEAALESCREEMERLRTKRAADEQTERALRTELADIGARLEVLAKASARCPLCEQALGDELRKRLLTDARSLADSKEASADELTRAGEDAARTLKQLEAKMSSIQPHVARAGPLQKQLGELQRRAEEARAAGTKAERLEQRAQELRRMLESQSFAPEERRRLTAAEQRLAETAYEPAEHRRVQETIRALAGTEKKLGALEAARASLPQDEEHLAQVCESLKAAQQGLAEAKQSGDELRRQAADAGPAAAALAEVEKQRAAARQQRDGLVGELAALRAEIEACRRAREDAERCRRQRGSVESDRVVYGELAEAFGRQGVQALAIETVVPQLAEDANELLGRMTEGRMRVDLVTQRERADGGAAETLDIHIADELGTRRYELYSGGEAFRVDFAVRVALARLLARRAGAKLQTLVVDEGFGTQDAQSRDRLVECVNAIQDDFEKVLIITHIEELKDAFQERIEVTKDEAGSHISRQAAAA